MYQARPRIAAGNHYLLPPGRMAGLGTTPPGPSSTQIAQQVGSIASVGTTGAILATVGPSGFILGLPVAAAIPIIGAAIAGITLGVVAILNSGCGDACIVTSNWANQAADLLEKNIKAYFALPAPRPVEAKAQALANFDQIWNYLVQQCSNPSLSTAGQHCISDRQSGACHWTQTGQPEFPGQPEYGACWNWFNSFRDPIAADPAVVTQQTVNPTVGTDGTAGAVATVGGVDLSNVLLLAGAAALAFGLMGSG